MSTNYQITITGLTPLLLHNDNISWSEKVSAWTRNPVNKSTSVAGDDRWPAWRWFGCLYEDITQNVFNLPSDNIMAMFRESGKRVPTSKRGTFMAMTQSGITVNQPSWEIVSSKGTIPFKPFTEICDSETQEMDFTKHEAKAAEYGFSLFSKRATVGQAKHIRVRPRFDQWSVTGSILVTEPAITPAVLDMILTAGGNYVGLGDWRPSSKKPGSWGRFTSTVTPI